MAEHVRIPYLPARTLRVVQCEGPVALPVFLTPILGREQDAARLSALLGDPGIRLVSLLGPAGVGKTRLAVEVMANARDRFTGGIHYLALTTASDPGKMLGEFWRQSRFSQKTEDQPMLLVLDHVEQLCGDPVTWLTTMLVNHPLVTVLFVSQIAMNIPGEQRYALAPLANPTPGEDRDRNNPAVTLFLERARCVRPDFCPTLQVLRTIDLLCDRLDRLPFAIEVAASRMKIMTPESMLAQLSDRFALLSGSSLHASCRFHSIHDALDWSHDLLAPAAQVLFRRLSVFEGGFSLDAAIAIAGGQGAGDDRERILNLLASLVDHSLVLGQPGLARFRMLETTREYAAEYLVASGKEGDVRDAHAAWCQKLVDDLRVALKASPPQVAASRLEIERVNMTMALDWLVAHGGQRELIRLASSLLMCWLEYQAALDDHEDALQARGQARGRLVMSLDMRAWTFEGVSGAEVPADVLHRAVRLAERSLDTGCGPDSHLIGVEILTMLGELAEAEGCTAIACDFYRQGLSMSFEMANHWWGLSLLVRLAILAVNTGDLRCGVRLFGKVEQLHDAADACERGALEEAMQRAIQTARTRLGDGPFAALWAEGQAQSMDTLIDEVHLAVPETGDLAGGQVASPLSPREMDVLRLIMANLTDMQIADVLFISRRTVNTHVSHILNKLDASSRRDAVRRATVLGLLASTGSAPYT